MGVYYSNSSGAAPGHYTNSTRPILGLLDRIDAMYVDSVDRNELETLAVEAILEHLDPHSTWIPPEYFAEMAEQMDSQFEGIGVEFTLLDDTIRVVRILPGGPSEAAGLQAGDRIVWVNDSLISGPELTNDKVKALLKGPGGTTVQLGLVRANGAGRAAVDSLTIAVTRGAVLIPSIVASEILEIEGDSSGALKVGYIKVERFARNTHRDFSFAIQDLMGQGASRFIIDLQANSGGYLEEVIPMVEMFFDRDELVLYTEGKARPRKNFVAEFKGPLVGVPVAVVVDGGSASASEIFAGAMQDQDRATIVGRRTFGKGLVQEQYAVGQGAVRLTVARYYTPSGRLIQKPYGEDGRYAEHGEAGEVAESLADSSRFKTASGREVYGGGGIAPDVEVERDSGAVEQAVVGLLWSGWPGRASYDLVDANRVEWHAMGGVEAWLNAWDGAELGLELMVDSVKLQRPDLVGELTSDELVEFKHRAGQFLAQRIARQLWGESAGHRFSAAYDPSIQHALYQLEN
jgi:carboxyl-terminal processing protease